MREHGDTCGDDELYIRDKMVVWSRGHGDNKNVSQIIKTFTMDTPVQQVICQSPSWFMLQYTLPSLCSTYKSYISES